MIPTNVKAAIDRHIYKGSHNTGRFVRAVLENNLKDAFMFADLKSRDNMFDIVKYLYNEAPAECWGDKEAVENWEGLDNY